MTNEQKLEQQIDSALAEFLQASEQVARNAVNRAFQSAGREAKRSSAARTKRDWSDRPRARRSAEELASLSEKLVSAVAAQPGASMSTLASHVGENSASLTAIAARLKREGRIRTAGSRRNTRYFPATLTKSAA